jgi:hypothetical protein
MRMRPALMVLIGLVVVGLVCCAFVTLFVGPRARDTFRGSLSAAISTQVADVVSTAGVGTGQPGTYTIDAAEFRENLTAQLDSVGGARIQDIVFEITPEEIRIGFETPGESPVITARAQAVDGRLDITDVTSSGGMYEFILPAGIIAEGIEQGFNSYLDANGLRLVSVEQGDGTLTFVVE